MYTYKSLEQARVLVSQAFGLDVRLRRLGVPIGPELERVERIGAKAVARMNRRLLMRMEQFPGEV